MTQYKHETHARTFEERRRRVKVQKQQALWENARGQEAFGAVVSARCVERRWKGKGQP